MTTAVQRRRGTNTEHATFTGLDGEITVNTTTYTLHIHDGSTVGGIILAKADGSNIVTSSIDINGGTIDGTVIGGSSAAAITGTTITGTSFVSSGDMTFGDNNKAVFGAGSDLQISHDGSNSYINELGAGNLVLQTDGAKIGLASSSPFEWMIEASVNDAVTLYYDGAAKLATTATGIDVTGTVTAGTGYFFGGTSSYLYESASDTANLRVGANGPYMLLGNDLGSNVGGMGNSSGALALYAGTEQVRITNSGLVGIGTTSPATALDVVGAGGGGVQATISDGANQGNLQLSKSSNYYGLKAGNDYGGLLFFSNSATERMRIDSSGNVGIGTSSPTANLSVGSITTATGDVTLRTTKTTFSITPSNTDAGGVELGLGWVAGGQGPMKFNVGGERMRIDSSGLVGINTTSPATSLDVKSESKTQIRIGETTGNFYFDIGRDNTDGLFQITGNQGLGYKFLNATTEVMRISSAGNVGIGTSSPAGKQHTALATSHAWGAAWSSGTAVFGGAGSTDGAFGISYNDTDGAVLGAIAAGVAWKPVDIRGSELSFSIATTEKMRLDSNGYLLYGTTAFFGNGISISKPDVSGVYSTSSGTSSTFHYRFANANGAIGSIVTSASATSYNTSSDQRLKENITDANDAGDKIDAIQVRQYDWKVDGSHQDYGMIAQELMTVAPEAVSGDPESDEMMGVDYSKLVPMLIKEIQSLRARVAQLETN